MCLWGEILRVVFLMIPDCSLKWVFYSESTLLGAECYCSSALAMPRSHIYSIMVISCCSKCSFAAALAGHGKILQQLWLTGKSTLFLTAFGRSVVLESGLCLSMFSHWFRLQWWMLQILPTRSENIQIYITSSRRWHRLQHVAGQDHNP